MTIGAGVAAGFTTMAANAAGPVMALIAALGAFLFLRGRRPEAAPAPTLTADERARLDALMADQDS